MKKKILSILLAITLVASVFGTAITTNAASQVKGDANGDGELSTNDALIVLRSAAGIEDSLSSEARVLCDIDGDGYISLYDARRILRAAAGLTSLEPTGAFKGYSDKNNIFASQAEALSFFNVNINKVKSERYGFTAFTDTEMLDFNADEITFLGQPANNTASLIDGIFSTVGSESDQEYYVIAGDSSTNKINIEGRSYVSLLENADVLGMKVEYDSNRHPEKGGIITISVAIPDVEKCDINDSAYIKVFNSEKLLTATETTINSILTKLSDGTETVHYYNAVLVAEFEMETGFPVSYSTTYKTNVKIPEASKSLYSFKNLRYETENTATYTDFTYD